MNRPYYGLNGRPVSKGYPLSPTRDPLIAERKMWFGTMKIITEWTGKAPHVFRTKLDAKGRQSVVAGYATLDAALAGHKYWTEFYRNPTAIIKTIVQ